MVGANWGVISGAGKSADVVDDGSPYGDRAEQAVTHLVHGDGDFALIILLIFKGDGDAIGQVEVVVTVVEFALVMEESGVLESEELHGWCSTWWTQGLCCILQEHMAKKKALTDSWLTTLWRVVLDGGEIAKDKGDDGLLRLPLAGVSVGVAFQLL